MSTEPIWATTEGKNQFPALSKNIEVDVAIVGGGITGLTTGLLLQRAGKSVAIVEKDHIASGESGHTSGHLTEVLDERFYRLISVFGIDSVRKLVGSQRIALAQIEKLVQEYGIECDFDRVPGYLFSTTSNSEDILKEEQALRELEVPYELLRSAPLPFSTRLSLRVDNQAQFHITKYLLSLAEAFVNAGGKMYENTCVQDLSDGEPCRLETKDGMITSREIVVAANIPLTNTLFLNTTTAAYRSYVVAASLQSQIPVGLYWDNATPYHYIRTVRENGKNIVIVGGEDHKTGADVDTNKCFKKLEQYVLKNFNTGPVQQRWSGQIINSVDSLPFIGVNIASKNTYVATGYGGNGLTFGTLAGTIISDLLLGMRNEFESLYHVARMIAPSCLGRFISENKDFPLHFLLDRISGGAEKSVQSLLPNEGRILKLDKQKIAVSRDGKGKIHCLSPVCPHLGCYVQWNKAEATWDCPCHGSRFNAQGTVLNGPAHENLKPAKWVAEDSGEKSKVAS